MLIPFFSQVAFHNFTPFFNHHSLFQEIPPAVCSAIDEFSSKSPDFEIPDQFQKVVALTTKIKEILNSGSSKRADNIPSGPRSDRTKKNKPSVSCSPISCLFDVYRREYYQGKRPRLSKELIDDSDGDEPAIFLDSPASLTIKPSSSTSTSSPGPSLGLAASKIVSVLNDSGSVLARMDVDTGQSPLFSFYAIL